MRALLALVLSALALTGCYTLYHDDIPFADRIKARAWVAEAIDGKDVIDGTTVTLKVEGDRVSGKAGCNGYGGPVEINGDRIKFGALFSTKMACMGNGVMEQEQHYLTVLRDATRGEVRADGTLVLTGSSGAVELRSQ